MSSVCDQSIDSTATPSLPAFAASVDVRHQVCPMTYVYAKLELEKLKAGDVLEVWIQGESPLRNIPRSVREEGHAILAVMSQADGTHRILIEKRERK